MKNYRLLAGVAVCGLGLMQSPSYAQQKLPPDQLEAIVNPSLKTCSQMGTPTKTGRVDTSRVNPANVIPAADQQSFAMDRVAKTLNGVWRGQVAGDSSDVHVDYFWIIDAKRNQGLIIAQRSGRESVDASTVSINAPKLTYLMCAHDGYSPGSSTPQIHQFVKVSNTTDNAADIVERATGMKSVLVNPTLEDLWRRLVDSGYFNDLPYVAYAGGFFNPIQFSTVPGTKGSPAPKLGMRWDAEYRGGGATKLKYTTNVPMKGSEQVQFVGTTATSGDYLVASPGNGKLWMVETIVGGDYNLAFDSVTLGPLEQ